MKLTVKTVSEPWKHPDAAPAVKPIYTLTVEELGEPIRTTDLALAKIGVHEAEEYENSSGKTRYRTSRAQASGGMETPMETRKSIEAQTALKTATEHVNGNIATEMDDTSRLRWCLLVAGEMFKWLQDPLGYDTDKIGVANKDDDLPPVDLYDI